MRLRIVLVYWSYLDEKYFVTSPIHRSAEDYAQVQIKNMLDLGYRPNEIILATNFAWEYMGVRSIILRNSEAPPGVKKVCSKMLAVKELMDRKIIRDKYVYWLHDLDVVQNIMFPIPKEMEDVRFGLVPFSSSDLLGATSFFFKSSAYDIIKLWCDQIAETYKADERALNYGLIEKGMIKEGIDYAVLNRSYSYTYKAHSKFWKRQKKANILDAKLGAIYESVDMPLKAVDFNYMPYRNHMKGWGRKSWIGELSRRLIYLLKKHIEENPDPPK